MYKPFISIIITILNGERTIKECLESINKQTFENYEVIIVDGGSTDNTISLIKDSKISSLKLDIVPGLSLYGGLNRGIDLAHGKWLYFIGCDDKLYESITLSKVVHYIESNDIGQVFVGNVLYRTRKALFNPRLGSPYFLQYFVHHQGMFYSENLFVGQSYDESLKIVADYKFNMNLALKKINHVYMDIIVCDFSDEGVSNKKIQLGSEELLAVNRGLFSGFAKGWVVIYGTIRQKIWLVRHRHGFLHLKEKFRSIINIKKIYNN